MTSPYARRQGSTRARVSLTMFGANVPPASSPRMTKDAQGSSDAAVDPSSASLPMNRWQTGRLPQDDMFGEGVTETFRSRWSAPIHSERSRVKETQEVPYVVANYLKVAIRNLMRNKTYSPRSISSGLQSAWPAAC